MKSELFFKWLEGNTIIEDKVDEIAEQFDAIMSGVTETIEEHCNNDEPYLAYGLMLSYASFINTISKKNPSILRQLQKWIKRLKDLLEVIARKVKAENYSIGVGVPFGISIIISFKI